MSDAMIPGGIIGGFCGIVAAAVANPSAHTNGSQIEFGLIGVLCGAAVVYACEFVYDIWTFR
jgi:hypothetical protein